MKTLIISWMIGGMCIPPLSAQSSSSNISRESAEISSSTGRIAVRDYKSFKEYVELERARMKVPQLTMENAVVKGKLKKLGIEFVGSKKWARSKDRKNVAYLSSNKHGIAVIDVYSKKANIMGLNGTVVRKIQLQSNPEGLLDFSDSRLFDFRAGFDGQDAGFSVYDLSGQLVKNVIDSGRVDSYLISESQKHLLVAAGLPDTGDFLILYDMNGNELWRAKVDTLGHSEIKTSPDDRFIALLVPGTKTFYLFQMSDGKILSKDYYVD